MTDDKTKGPKSLINPYELLGIDIKNKDLNLKDVKQAYYGMALICHPDKGGSDNDMNVVQQAYNFVKEQMKNNSKPTDEAIKSMKNEFDEYCKKQEEAIPSFPDIYNDVREWQKNFNAKFEEERQKTAGESQDSAFGYCSPMYGYGNQMDTSVGFQRQGSLVLDYNQIKQQYTDRKVKSAPKIDKDFFRRGQPQNNYQSNIGGPICSFGKEIVESSYTGPTAQRSLVGYSTSKELISNDEASFYSSGKNFSIADYKEAHQEACLFDLTQYKEKTTPLDELLKMRINDRQKMDDINATICSSKSRIELQKDAEERERRDCEQAQSYVIANMPSDMDIYIEDLAPHHLEPKKKQKRKPQQTMLEQLVNVNYGNNNGRDNLNGYNGISGYNGIYDDDGRDIDDMDRIQCSDDDFDDYSDDGDFIIVDMENVIKGVRTNRN